MLDEVYKKSQSIMYIGDKENSNTDSALVSTKRSLIFNELNKELYKKFFLTVEEIQAIRDGYIYIHDMSARRDTMNCCLFDVKNVLNGGFYGGNLGLYDKIKPLLKAAPASFGITAFNELQQLHNKKSLVEDGKFALEGLRTWDYIQWGRPSSYGKCL